MKLIAIALVLLLSAAAGAQNVAKSRDAAALLAKARVAFMENQKRERYWNWTAVENRSILDKNGKVIENIPSVTVDSPIRSDGRRCNAVLAWGDGREPYLANASADERCSVEKEMPGVFRIEALFESHHVKMESRDASSIVLAVGQDKELVSSADPSERCAARWEAGFNSTQQLFSRNESMSPSLRMDACRPGVPEWIIMARNPRRSPQPTLPRIPYSAAF
jgi:hypothetical protein